MKQTRTGSFREKIRQVLMRTFCFLAAFILFAALFVSGLLLLQKYLDDRAGKKEYQLIGRIADTGETGDFFCLPFLEKSFCPDKLPAFPACILDKGETGAYREKRRLPFINEAALSEMNQDYEAWIYIPGTAVNYPVVYPKTDTQYLKVTFQKKRHSCGCLFFESSYLPFSGRNTVIYGHNMRSGEMFGSLKQYLNSEYMKEHRDIYICRRGIWRRYRAENIVLITNSDLSYYQPKGFTGENTEKNALYGRTLNEPVFLTLSTCHGKDRKLVLQARLKEILLPLFSENNEIFAVSD